MNFKYVDTHKLMIDIQNVKSIIGSPTNEDYKHLVKLDIWCYILIISGIVIAIYSSIIPSSIITAFLIVLGAMIFSIGSLMKFIVVGHTVMHGAYDSIQNIPNRYNSKYFGIGWRRYIDVFTWIDTESWILEHNKLHHGNIGTVRDPDSPLTKFKWLKNKSTIYKILNILYHSMTASITYYAKETIKSYNKNSVTKKSFFIDALLPHIIQLVVLLLLFSIFGIYSFLIGIIFIIVSEIASSMISFFLISATHTGGDIYYFSGESKSYGELLLREILGTVNYTGGSDIKDFLNGFLGYHIEHHVLQGETNLFYKKSQPYIKEICKEHNIPYITESSFSRILKLFKNYMWIESPKRGIT